MSDFGGDDIALFKGSKKKQLYIGILRRKYQYPWEPIRIFMECQKGSVSNLSYGMMMGCSSNFIVDGMMG